MKFLSSNLSELEYALANSLKRLLFIFCRFPAFEYEFIKKKIDRPTTSRAELECYMASCTLSGRRRAYLLTLIYLAYCLKNAYIPYASFKLLDHNNLERNLHEFENVTSDHDHDETWHSTSLKSFACLRTNCSRLSARCSSAAHEPTERCLDPSNEDSYSATTTTTTTTTTLVKDLVRLPIFVLCHPVVEILYTPVQKLDGLGIFISAISSFIVFLLGSWATIQQIIAPAANETFMFLCAPHATRELWRIRARQLLHDLEISFENFRTNSLIKREPRGRSESLWTQLRLKQLAETVPTEEEQHAEVESEQVEAQLARVPSNGALDGPRRRASLLRWLSRDNNHHEGHDGPRASCTSRENEENHEPALERRIELGDILDECLPIIRCAWWRPWLARIFNHTLLAAFLFIGLVGVAAFGFINELARSKRRQMKMFAREVERQQCALWRSSGNLWGELGDRIDLNQIEFTWNMLGNSLAAMNIVSGLSIAMLFAYYWAGMMELGVWLAEMRMFLVASLAVAKVRFCSPLSGLPPLGGERSGRVGPAFDIFTGPQPVDFVDQETVAVAEVNQEQNLGELILGPPAATVATAASARASCRTFYDLKSLRQRFQRECHFFLFGFQSRLRSNRGRLRTDMLNSKIVDALHFREFVHQAQLDQEENNRHWLVPPPPSSLNQALPVAATATQEPSAPLRQRDIETMEQIYINFRIFVEFVQQCTPSVRVLVTITYLLNYGLVCIAIMCSRKLPDLKEEPLLIIVFGWIISNCLILIAATFHANAKKLQPLVWTIVAQLTDSQSLRLQHLRYLWMRQAQVLDDSGGLALTAFKVRVTYVNIIQLAVGTATVIVIFIRSV